MVVRPLKLKVLKRLSYLCILFLKSTINCDFDGDIDIWFYSNFIWTNIGTRQVNILSILLIRNGPQSVCAVHP